MTRKGRKGWAAICLTLAAVVSAQGSAAVAQEGAGHYGASVRPVGRMPVGNVIADVDVEIAASSGDAARDAAALRAARAAAGGLVGRSYGAALVDAALAGLSADGATVAARHRAAYDGARGALVLLVELDLSDAPPDAAAERPAFPVLHEDDRSKLTLIVATGAGVYSDVNPWFGAPALFNASSPVAGDLPGARATWTEGYAELGIGGITRLGESDLYLFGAASGTFSASRGQDVFRDDERNFLHPDKLYAGLLYADRECGNGAQFTLGRQTWTLNSGFLISMVAGSSNAGERGATYLGPRNTTDLSAVLTADIGRASAAVFYIDPDEIEDLESNSTFAGANLGWSFGGGLEADASLIAIPTSDALQRLPGGATLPREGTTTAGLHALWRQPAENGLWLEGEAYRQWNPGEDVSAHAGHGTVGWIGRALPWSPSLSYRYATFSGDDPATATYERFDSMMSTGLGNWLQGVSLGKVQRNGNLNTHRVQLNLAPRTGMNLTFTWHALEADRRNNLGGNPALAALLSRDIGQEFTATLRWSLTRSAYLQLVASHALPGAALTRIGADEPWTTLQASLYYSF